MIINNIDNFKQKKLTPKEEKIYSILIKKIKNWIIQKVNSANAKGISLGISGGIDSATLAILANEAFPETSYFYYFKTKVDSKTENDIQKLEKRLNKKIKTIDLTEGFKNISKTLKIKSISSKSNLKSRIFMSSLYALSEENKTLVLGTDNFDEYYLGFFTKFGDGGCDLLPFANIKKHDVYMIADMIDVPLSIINKKPSANLCSNLDDEKQLEFSYFDFEQWLINKTLVSDEISEKISKWHNHTQHKRDLIPKGPKVK